MHVGTMRWFGSRQLGRLLSLVAIIALLCIWTTSSRRMTTAVEYILLNIRTRADLSMPSPGDSQSSFSKYSSDSVSNKSAQLEDEAPKLEHEDQNGVRPTKLNVTIDIEQIVPSTDELYKRITIVMAFSQNHYREALAFIASIQATMPEKKIIIYDLGIDKATVPKVKRLCNVELRPFPWKSYPEHVKGLHNYAWKPILIDLTLKEFGAIFWGDASVRFQASLREVLPVSTNHHGFMSHWHSFDPKTKTPVKHQYFFTNAKMYAKLGVDRQKYYASKNMAAYPAANRQLYVNGSVIQRAIVQPMLECALELRCIAPEGSRVGSHRFDASLLAILIYKNLRGEWTPENNDNAIFDEVIGIDRSTKGGEKARTCQR